MFTGIVRELLTIQALDNVNGVVRLTFTVPQWSKDRALELGESILLNGICTTVTSVTPELFTVELMPETMRVTTAGMWQVGQQIHAEPSVTIQTALSGSLVYGHVDGVTTVTNIDARTGELVLRVALQPFMQGFVMPKGGITLNGANLTVVDVQPDSISVHLIPQTQALTTFAKLSVGDALNVELDYFTKVIKHLVQPRLG